MEQDLRRENAKVKKVKDRKTEQLYFIRKEIQEIRELIPQVRMQIIINFNIRLHKLYQMPKQK